MGDYEKRLQRKVKIRKFAIDNSWRGRRPQTTAPENGIGQPQNEDQRRWDRLIENLQAADGAKFNDGYFPILSHRRVLGPTIIFCKRVVRKLIKIFFGWYLFPIYARQSLFNEKIVNAVAMEKELLLPMNDQIAAVWNETRVLRQELDAVKQTADGYREELASLSQRMGEQFAENRERVQELRIGFDELCQQAKDLGKDSAGLHKETENMKKDSVALRQETEDLKKDSTVLRLKMEDLKKEDSALRREAAGLRQDIAALLEDGERMRDRLRRIENLPTEDEQFYHEFEERFRGSRDEIRERLQIYIPYIKEHLPDWSKGRFIDVGSGRGEWLDVLKENGAADCIGVDLNALQNAVAESFGHQTVCEDCIQYLSQQPDESVDLVSGFQIIEHLCMSDVMELLRQSYRVLKKGGMILFETPNPVNLTVGADTFYIDPSHKRPLDPRMMVFIAKWCGFEDAEFINANAHPDHAGLSSEGRDEADAADIGKVNQIFSLLFGPMDYGLFAVKE